jgi:hypothetical protein
MTAAVAIWLGCGPKASSDQSIVTTIQAKLYSDPLTKPASIAVAVQNGVVTLSGNVGSSDVALEAMKIANGTPGVRTVNDSMTVNGVAAANQIPNSGNSSMPAISGTPAATPTTPTPVASAPSPAPAPAADERSPEQVQTASLVVPAGERLQVRTIDAISSQTADPGQVYRASLDAPLVHRGRVIIPAGAPVSLVVVAARSAGRIKGQSELELRASSIAYHGHSYRIDSSVFEEAGKARGKQTAVRTGIGAAAGAIIGAIAGGGKGAAIGSAAGGGAGLGYNAFTHGQQVKIPSETVLTFRLEAPLKL